MITDAMTEIPVLDILAMATTNLEKIYGLNEIDEVVEVLEKDFVAYKGGSLMDFGGSKVVAFNTPEGIAIF